LRSIELKMRSSTTSTSKQVRQVRQNLEPIARAQAKRASMMRKPVRPECRFSRFENVVVTSNRLGEKLLGRDATVIWQSAESVSTANDATEMWFVTVSIPSLNRYQCFLESDLRSSRTFSTSESQLGKCFEISFDTELGDGIDIGTAEGSFRRPNHFWEVFSFTECDVEAISSSYGQLQNGMPWIDGNVPVGFRLNSSSIIKEFVRIFSGVWIITRGPDSFYLR
jgi:hypothetical protein